MNEREAYIALNMMEKVGPVGVRSLAEALGSARAIFEADTSELRSAQGIGPETAAAISGQRDSVPWEDELEKASAMGIRILTQIDDEYPRQLLEIHDPPLALYACGNIEERDKHSIAIVGTRRPSHYGRETAALFSARLAAAGITVVSGLAEGIDAAAHEAALRAKGRTIAVMGSGFNHVYPSSHKNMARLIADHGAVLTEFPLERQPDKTTFPMRNRIISGLSKGVLVVEAGVHSGALITANQALDQGRSVFAVPGRIDSPQAHGSNELIKNGAKLTMTIDDILEEFEFLLPRNIMEKAGAAASSVQNLTSEEEAIASLLDRGELDVDSLIRNSGFKPASVNALLMSMEMKRLVRMLPGRIVELVR